MARDDSTIRQISLRLDPRLIERADAAREVMAELGPVRGVSRSDVLREALARGLDQLEADLEELQRTLRAKK